jgi:hypothetical protein
MGALSLTPKFQPGRPLLDHCKLPDASRKLQGAGVADERTAGDGLD